MTSMPRSVGTATQSGTGGNWSDLANITASDDFRATVNIPASSYSKYLECTNFNFNIPSTAVIKGITVRIERAQTTSEIVDDSVKLLNDDGSGGETITDESQSATWLGTPEGYVNFGGSSFVWGGNFTPSKINSNLFGVKFRCRTTNFVNPAIGEVDHVQIIVDYIDPYCRFPDDPIIDLRYGINAVTGVYYGNTQIL